MSDRHVKRDPRTGRFVKGEPGGPEPPPESGGRVGQVKPSKKKKKTEKPPDPPPAKKDTDGDSDSGPDMFDGSLIIEL